ncbi:hypothetical protein G6F65_020571 [Rhizopus arrhizus]|nr:hypothetical protein G6F65_020571 [Rhizopus arrhizus]
MRFVGLDVIGDYLTEVNVTSPTCVRELDAQPACADGCRTCRAAPATARSAAAGSDHRAVGRGARPADPGRGLCGEGRCAIGADAGGDLQPDPHRADPEAGRLPCRGQPGRRW